MDNPFKSPAILSLCPGMRGLETGIERVVGAIRTVAYVEIEAFICQNMAAQMEQGLLAPAPIWTNVKTFDGKPFRDRIHGITGGYPCQPFSHAGKRGGAEDPRHLWPHIKRIIKEVRPIWCFFENVEGHVTLGLETVLRELRKIGYAVEVGIFSATEAGAPHQRKRVFILAVANTASAGKWRSEGNFYNGELPFESIGSGSMENTTSVRWSTQRAKSTRFEREPIINNAGQLANTACITERKQDNEECANSRQNSRQDSFGRSTFNLANTNGDAAGGFFGSIQEESGETENERQERERRGAEFDPCCTAMANSSGIRSIESLRGRQSELTHQNGESWPAGPGQRQHDWEEPRLESKLGFTVNGYNFREDLLRMAGNAVVPQTAELAFRTLLNKFL